MSGDNLKANFETIFSLIKAQSYGSTNPKEPKSKLARPKKGRAFLTRKPISPHKT
jgi:hypothetical protein